MDQLSSSYRLLAPDCYCAGKSPKWDSDRLMTLHDEVNFLQPVFSDAGQTFSLVAHSYGAAVALIAALTYPDRIRSLVLYEPTLFALIESNSEQPNDAEGIRNVVARSIEELQRGQTYAAAEHFIDYWMGPGSWSATSEERKAPIAESVRCIQHWAHALFEETTPPAAFSAIRAPVLLMSGARSTVSALAVIRRLALLLPQARQYRFSDLGHMGPVTHADKVNAVIAKFLCEV